MSVQNKLDFKDVNIICVRKYNLVMLQKYGFLTDVGKGLQPVIHKHYNTVLNYILVQVTNCDGCCYP